MFTLFNVILIGITILLDNLLGTTFVNESKNLFTDETVQTNSSYGYIYSLYMALTFLPSLGVTLRRYHDTGVSFKTVLFNLFNLFGLPWAIYRMCTDSHQEENEYGISPKYGIHDNNVEED